MKTPSAFERARDLRIADEPRIRTDYRCLAHGCPNAGTMEKGVCFFHWRADPLTWPQVTEDICQNFDRLRNWGTFSAERQAMHRATSQKLFGLAGHKPSGLHSSTETP